jgi:hypothetical protein
MPVNHLLIQLPRWIISTSAPTILKPKHELVNNGTNISLEGGALESKLSLIGTLYESSNNKLAIDGSSIPKLKPTVVPLHVTTEEYTTSQESAFSDASSRNKNTNTTTSTSKASMSSERYAIITFAMLASSAIACILIFYVVRKWKKKTSNYLGRN